VVYALVIGNYVRRSVVYALVPCPRRLRKEIRGLLSCLSTSDIHKSVTRHSAEILFYFSIGLNPVILTNIKL
jgi:hypothetical protein